MFRILLIPVIVALILVRTDAASDAAAAVLLAGGLTDYLDGYVARRYGSTTVTGQWLDPLSDKLLIAAPALTLAALDRFPVWAVVVILVREASVSTLRAYLGSRRASLPASQIAKLKASLQLAAVALYTLPLSSAAGALKLGVLVAAVVVTVYSGLDYFLRLGARTRMRSADTR